ncbi:CDP-diacylglycerol--serine O-phosphatidyltransferase [candidate division KSB1 bacterium]|nr:CDP-diacylglycerol--serine O-phosphatidyltransferase [candidate division KSB1 bacterium]
MKNKGYINVPTLFTALNLFCGFLSIVQSVSGNLSNAAWLIFIAGVFDALDGRIARASGQNSEFGLQMDSLGDVVSAGVAPSILVYGFYLKRLGEIGLVISFLPLLFAAFRLARYNLFAMENGKKSDFVGMPAPMAAVTLGSLAILYDLTQWQWLMRSTMVLVPLVSLLMASTFKYDAFPRFSLREGRKNSLKLLAFVVTLILMMITPQFALFGFMLIYLFSGPVGAVSALLRDESTELAIIPKERTAEGDNLREGKERKE